jgi:hypothetical protein
MSTSSHVSSIAGPKCETRQQLHVAECEVVNVVLLKMQVFRAVVLLLGEQFQKF